MALIRIGGACLNQTPLDWTGNIANITAAIDAARQQKVEILCLPELCITGYGSEDMFLSRWVPAKALNKVADILPHTKDICVTVGLPMRQGSQVFNTICILADQQLLGCYAKHHLDNDGVLYEP